MMVNRSKLARELGIDRRTISKYRDGFQKSIIDDYYDTIKDLLGEKTLRYSFIKDFYGNI